MLAVWMSSVIDCPDPTIPTSAWFQRTPDGHGVVGCRRRDVTHRAMTPLVDGFPDDVTHRDVTWRLECDSGLQWKHDVTELLQNCSSRKYVTAPRCKHESNHRCKKRFLRFLFFLFFLYSVSVFKIKLLLTFFIQRLQTFLYSVSVFKIKTLKICFLCKLTVRFSFSNATFLNSKLVRLCEFNQ